MRNQKRITRLILLETLFFLLLTAVCFCLQSRQHSIGEPYSLVAIVLLGLGVVLSLAMMTLSIFFRYSLGEKISTIWRCLTEEHRLLYVLVMGSLFLICATVGILVLGSRYAHYLGDWKVIFDQTRYLVYAIYLVLANFLFLALLSAKEQIRKRSFWNGKRIFNSIVLFLVFGLTILHWMILLYQVRIFKMIPGWFWGFHVKPFSRNDFFLLGMLFALLAGSIFIFRLSHGKGFFNKPIFSGKRKTWIGLLVCAGLFYLFQIGFGWIDGQSFESIRQKYAASTHKGYAEHASDQPALPEALVEYEERYSADHYLGTKPPGVLLIYAGLQKISNLVQPVDSFDERFERLTWAITRVFPFLAVLAIFPLYLLGSKLLGQNSAFYPVLLYITCPNVLLVQLFLDQALYPFLFLMGLLLIWWVINKPSFFNGLVLGVFCFTVLYFSFSMLPLVALGAVWIGIELILRKETRDLKKSAWVLSGFLSGFLMLLFLFRVFLNYDPLLRYQMAMLKHTSLKLFQTGLIPMVLNTLLNNVEMASWVGFPLFTLAATGAVYAFFAVIKKKSQLIDRLALGFLIVYIAVNLFSKTRGEVGRVWLFMVPVLCLTSIKAILEIFKNEERSVSVIVLVQFITTYLLFKFQDFVT